jgi:prohibitin 2
MKKLILIVLTLMTSACGFEIVDTGYRGVKTKFGEVVGEPLPEGLHFYNWFTSDITEFGVRENNWSAMTAIFTKDTQRVDVTFSVVYYPDPKSVHHLYREVGPERALEEKIIKPIVLGSIKDAIGQVIADELVSKREAVTRSALAEVVANLKARNVIVTDLQFTNLDFDDAYEQAVEAKVVATQNAQKAKNETVQIKEEAEQKVTTAKAEAEAMRIKSAALAQNKGLVQFEAVQKWDGQLPQYIFGGGAVPFIDIQKLGKAE